MKNSYQIGREYIEVENNQEPSILFKYSFLVFFVFMTFGALFWFSFCTIGLIKQIYSQNPSIIFDKGSFYLLGVSVALGSLLYNMVYEGLMKKELTAIIAKRITRAALAGIGLMIILPQIIHYAVEDYMENNGYMICAQASSSWLMYKHIAYVSNAETCIDLIFEKEKKLSEPLF